MSYLRSNRATIESNSPIESLPGVSHIIPEKLYPAVAGKLLDGSTSHSGAYGTAQSDTRSYYYTDIKGSKPIKDPRIGAHFGSQRHPTKSLQKLEQESGTQGANVFSVDGREWIRLVEGPTLGLTNPVQTPYNDNGLYVGWSTGFMEITGYFIDVNFINSTNTTERNFTTTVDGGTVSGTNSSFQTGMSNPLGGVRFVDSGNIGNLGLGLTLGIHTLKIATTVQSQSMYNFGFELIAQDTSNRNNIQIPSQNVVSYGKQFTVSGTPHYNPFAYAADGTTAVAIGDTTSHGKVADGWAGGGATYFDSTLDTATSLGLSAWETGGNFYRPVNGGRIVKWVDSGGVIKTSVNMIPPSGQSINYGSEAALPTSHAWTTVYQPKFSSTTLDHSRAEVAKTFNVKEFGNGAANGGAGAAFADVSMLNTTADNIAFVMDDGLTSISVQDGSTDPGDFLGIGNGNDESGYFTFIGTGVTYLGGHSGDPGPFGIAQNLPYGTHVLQITRDTASSDTGKIRIDDIEIWDQPSGRYGMRYPRNISFYQPKMPPIPEDAVVIADYMLMADFVPQTPADNNPNRISKGTRLIACSRDFFYDGSAGHTVHANSFRPLGQINTKTGVQAIIQDFGTGTVDCTLPYFGFTSGEMTDMRGTDVAQMQMQLTNSSGTIQATNVTIVSSGTVGSSNTLIDTDGVVNTATFSKSDGVLGSNKARSHYTGQNASNYDWMYFCGMCVSSPIHTSSHYQTFESPFAHNLVGGDRNMEQTNLVVTPDGQTWDEVTRDTSYMGYESLKGGYDDADVSGVTSIGFNDWRGTIGAYTQSKFFNKDFAIANTRVICLKAGSYSIFAYTIAYDAAAQGAHATIYVNGSTLHQGYTGSSGHSQTMQNVSADLEIGDYVEIKGRWNLWQAASGYWIKRNPERKELIQDRANHRNWHPRLEYSRSKRN